MDRFSTRQGANFSRGNPWTSFTGGYTSAGFYAYGFGLHSDTSEPSGTLNFSRIDTAILQVRTKAAVIVDITAPSATTVPESMTTVGANILNTIYVWGPNFNVLRIASGMGGMAYAN